MGLFAVRMAYPADQQVVRGRRVISEGERNMHKTRRRMLAGLATLRGPARRDDPADNGGASGGDPASGGGGGAPVPPPAVPPAPAAFDPATLSPEVKAYLEAQIRAADTKARTGSKEAAAKAVRDEITGQLATALGLKPAEVDPATVAKELADQRIAYNALLSERAVEKAARTLGGDEELVPAWLAAKGKLKGLDPSAADFDSKINDLVKAEIEANPKLKGAAVVPAPAPAAGGSGSAVSGGAGSDGNRRAGSLFEAVAAQYKK